VEYVAGMVDELVTASVHTNASNSTSQIFIANGVGVDSTTVNSAQQYGAVTPVGFTMSTALYKGYPGVGYHALNWLEYSTVSGTTVLAQQRTKLDSQHSGHNGISKNVMH
jgi:hypothetical protein